MNVNLLSKITDYVLLNVCSLHSSGLYTGKAGVSLALFEVSGLMKDDDFLRGLPACPDI